MNLRTSNIATLFGGMIPVEVREWQKLLQDSIVACQDSGVSFPTFVGNLLLQVELNEAPLFAKVKDLQALNEWFEMTFGRPLQPAVALITNWAM